MDKGTGAALTSFIDPSLNWDDVPWILSLTKLPVMLKGVQTKEDAFLAYESGVAGIVVSNHGGRQLDYCRSGLECLHEIMTAMGKYPDWKRAYDSGRFEVFVDGGVRRGADVFKALALGAKMVGLGRPFIYGLAAYGEAGVRKVVQCIEEELFVVMRLMGTRTLSDLQRVV